MIPVTVMVVTTDGQRHVSARFEVEDFAATVEEWTQAVADGVPIAVPLPHGVRVFPFHQIASVAVLDERRPS